MTSGFPRPEMGGTLIIPPHSGREKTTPLGVFRQSGVGQYALEMHYSAIVRRQKLISAPRVEDSLGEGLLE